jgi:hypothetical protein
VSIVRVIEAVKNHGGACEVRLNPADVAAVHVELKDSKVDGVGYLINSPIYPDEAVPVGEMRVRNVSYWSTE